MKHVAIVAIIFAVWPLAPFAVSGQEIPAAAHIVLVIEENHSYEQIIGNTVSAPYINELANAGASFTNAWAIEHPSQPNYLDIFAGGNLGVRNDGCPRSLGSAPNLASVLIEHGYGFAGYSEGLPSAGSLVCGRAATSYVRKHNPWADFSNLPQAEINLPFASFPSDAEGFARLPAVSVVVPSTANDMHDGRDPDRIAAADAWLRAHLSRYVEWAEGGGGILILAWDEGGSGKDNHVPLIVVGGGVRAGMYPQLINHYSLLRFMEELFGLPLLGESKTAVQIESIWER